MKKLRATKLNKVISKVISWLNGWLTYDEIEDQTPRKYQNICNPLTGEVIKQEK